MKRRDFLGVLGLAAPAMAAEVAPENSAMRNELVRMEQALEGSFRNIEDPAPMQTLGMVRGVYLAGYGALFSVQVNLVPMANLSPFRQAYSDDEKRQLNLRKRGRLEDLELKLRGVLVDQGGRLMRVPREEKVAIAASLFHFPWEDRTQLPGQMVLSARRDALTGLQNGRTAKAEAKGLVELVWY